MELLRTLWKHLPSAAFDVLFVVGFGILPLIFGRLTPLALNRPTAYGPEGFWGFLINGQLAFYSMGSLATMLLFIFRDKIPSRWKLPTGVLCALGLCFLTWLVGLDPNLRYASVTFVGPFTLGLFVLTQLLRIAVETARSIDATDALRAGERSTQKLTEQLEQRKGTGRHA